MPSFILSSNFLYKFILSKYSFVIYNYFSIFFLAISLLNPLFIISLLYIFEIKLFFIIIFY